MLYKHKTLKDETHPVLLQIVHNEKPKRYTIAKPCMLNQWDKDRSCYNLKMPNFRNLNMLLTKEKSKVDKIVTELAKSDKPFTFEVFDRLYKGTTKPKNLYEFIEDTLILELEEKGKSGNSNVYKDTLRALKSYKGNMTRLQFEDIDYNFLIGFEHFLIKRNCGYGGISVYMRTLRAIINSGINRGYLQKDYYPFTTIQAKTGKYDISKLKSKFNPRGLTITEMDKIKNFDSDLNSHLKKDHFYFLFSYYCYGMNFTDMAFLEWTKIKANRIEYNRKKTGREFSILITESIQILLDHFHSLKQVKSKYIFPILDDEIYKTPRSKNDRIKKSLKEYNLHLKQIQKILEIEEKLTSYTARHTALQTLKDKKVSVETIQELAGHQDLQTTKHYLKSLPSGELDYVNEFL